jgi:predicted alpha/beta hydrolase
VGGLSIPALDGYALAASEFGGGDRTIVVAPAMAVPRRFYRRFAAWAGQRGWRVLTFDYRGIDRPAEGSGPATWAREDLAGVVAHALARGPVSLVGHSVVGQTLGLVPNARQLDRVALIASSHGHWRHYPAPSRWAIAGFWWLGIPALTRV